MDSCEGRGENVVRGESLAEGLVGLVSLGWGQETDGNAKSATGLQWRGENARRIGEELVRAKAEMRAAREASKEGQTM